MALGIFKSKEDKYWSRIKKIIERGANQNASWNGMFIHHLIIANNVGFHWDDDFSARFMAKHGREYLNLIRDEVTAGRFDATDVTFMEKLHFGGLLDGTVDVRHELLSLISAMLASPKDMSVPLKAFSMHALKHSKKVLDSDIFNAVINANFLNVELALRDKHRPGKGALANLCEIIKTYPELLGEKHNKSYVSIAEAFDESAENSSAGALLKLFSLLGDETAAQCKTLVTQSVKNYVESFNAIAAFSEEDEQRIIAISGKFDEGLLGEVDVASKGVGVSDVEIVKLGGRDKLIGSLVSFNNAVCSKKHVLFTQKQGVNADGEISVSKRSAQLTDNVEQALIDKYGEDAAPLAKKLARSMPSARLIV
jgi:hypothetical protein